MQNQKKTNMKYKLPVQEPSREQRGAENEKAQHLLAQPLPARDHVPHRTCRLLAAKSSANDNWTNICGDPHQAFKTVLDTDLWLRAAQIRRTKSTREDRPTRRGEHLFLVYTEVVLWLYRLLYVGRGRVTLVYPVLTDKKHLQSHFSFWFPIDPHLVSF